MAGEWSLPAPSSPHQVHRHPPNAAALVGGRRGSIEDPINIDPFPRREPGVEVVPHLRRVKNDNRRRLEMKMRASRIVAGANERTRSTCAT